MCINDDPDELLHQYMKEFAGVLASLLTDLLYWESLTVLLGWRGEASHKMVDGVTVHLAKQ